VLHQRAGIADGAAGFDVQVTIAQLTIAKEVRQLRQKALRTLFERCTVCLDLPLLSTFVDEI
jgi:hypothetical protein